MFEPSDTEYLMKQMQQNRVILFLGAGFSRDTINRIGQQFPLSKDLVRDLWAYLRYPGEADADLQTTYAAALSAPGGLINLKHFLEQRLLVRDVPSSYDGITSVMWNRIYTTNVDDLVEVVYARNPGSQKLSTIAFPKGEPRDRDQSLEYLQYVKLNGTLPGSPKDLTFSERDYAERSVDYDPLYDQFVRDYATLPVIFIGTELNELILWQHVIRRERRGFGGENRPRAFLVSPQISPPKRSVLRDYFVTPVAGTAQGFFEWVNSVKDRLPDRVGVLERTAPDLAHLLGSEEKYGKSTIRSLKRFYTNFHRVEIKEAPKSDRSMYLLGASPRWEDLWKGLDAPREINSAVQERLREAINSADTPTLIAITGSAGAGKSTILRRVALQLAGAGNTAFLTNSEELPSTSEFIDALLTQKPLPLLFFDNGEIALRTIGGYAAAARKRGISPVMAVAVRTNLFDRHREELEGKCAIIEVPVPNLTRPDIEGILTVLSNSGLLGNLRGLTPEKRIAEFEIRAKRQILVAMREATSGRGFDEIIADEYKELVNDETRALYLSVALATDHGFRITTQQFVACAKVPLGEAVGILNRNLKDIVLQSGPYNSDLLVRHRMIAQHVLNKVASRNLLADAYERLLRTLAHDVLATRPSNRNFRLYRALINHKGIFERFTRNVENARKIYIALRGYFDADHHYWLQFGSLELEYGNLEFAENYLAQASSLAPSDSLVLCARGQLLFKKAITASDITEAVELRKEAYEILEEQMADYGNNSEYPFHILGGQALRWLKRWENSREILKVELPSLIDIVENGLSHHPRSKRLRDLRTRLQSEYLQLGVSRGRRR